MDLFLKQQWARKAERIVHRLISGMVRSNSEEQMSKLMDELQDDKHGELQWASD